MATSHPGGIRPPDYIHEMALERLEDLMIQGIRWPRVLEILAAEGHTTSESTARHWRQEVHRRWSAEEQELRGARKDLRRAQAEARWRKACERADLAFNGRAGAAATATEPEIPEIPPDPRAAALLEREATRLFQVLVALDALTVPVQVKPDGRLDVAAMQPIEREAEIAKLLAERARAKGPVGGDNGGN